MKSKLLKTLVSAMLVGTMVLSAVGCGSKETAEAPAATEETTEEAATEKAGKVAIIYTVTGKGDLSFNDGCCKGAMKAAEDFGIELVEVEPTSLSDTEQAFEEMSAEGDYDLIIGITYEALDPIIKIAPNYPDQKYAIIDTDAGQPNCVSYIAKENESAFLAGCLAALIQTETENPMVNDANVVGIVGAMDADVINRHFTGYTCGAKYIDPSIEVLSDYVGSFDDTAAAQAIAQTMNNNGADIIYQVAAGAGLGVFKEAEDKGFMAIGLDDNQNYLDPDTIVASTIKKVDEYVYQAIDSAINGGFAGGEALALGLAEDGVDFTFDDSEVVVSQEIKDTIEAIKAKVASGELVIPSTLDGIEEFVANNKYVAE